METKHRLIFKVLFFPIIFLLVFSFFTERVSAAQVLTNPSYTGGSTGWTLSGTGTSYSSAYYYDSAGSVFFSCQSTLLNCRRFYASQSISTTIYSGSTGTLSFGYQFGIQDMSGMSENIKILDTDKRNLFARMFSGFLFPALAQTGTMSTVIKILPPGGTYTTITTLSMTNPITYHSPNPGGGSSSGSIDISSFLTNTGTYSIKVETTMSGDTSNKVWMLIDAWSMNISHASGPWGVTYTKNISAAGNITSPTTNPIAVNNASTSPTPTVTTNSGYTFNNYSITSGTCSGTFTASTGVCSSVTQDITIQANWTANTNTAPTITQTPYELTASTATAPTNQGSAITFRTTATDTANSYYLVICSTNAVTPGASGAAPTCGGTRYCVSSATASGVQASCSYTTTSGNAWSNAWYAFVCDNNTSSLCSTANQGSGDSGSPFYVNHPPSFTASAVSAAVNPGGTITWTTTASDPDGNTVKLLVCKTQAISAGACTGGSWCTSSLSASNPTCSYVATKPYADGVYNAYPYIVDQFNLASSGTAQGVNKAFTVNNVAPTIGTITLNEDSPTISLTESTTTSVPIAGNVTDDNGCTNLSATAEVSAVKGYLYRSGVAYTGCDTAGEADANDCYPEITCSAGTCTDGITKYTCSASVQYYADPTDADTPHAAENWLSTLKATDDDSASGTNSSATVELLSIAGGETTPTTLDFGNLSVGQSNTYIDVPLLTKTTGNSAINITVRASTASLCTDYPTCSTTGRTPIPIGQQKYSLNNTTLYSSGTSILTTTDALVEIKIPKQTTSTQQSKYSYWGIAIPTGTLPGVYNGLNVITYQKAAVVDW
ncbi:MAG TPA: hypothetical protein PLG47_02865 [Candidatus Dojkabacteria bacterium]|nr:hypothetical protein [Candidatus Dojkabacteria bacterium]